MAMKRSTGAILLVVGLFVLFVALNFIFFVDSKEVEEDEFEANRSSYKTTPYGTHAFYSLLEESGYQLTRFERPLTDLSTRKDIGTLFVISPPPVPGFGKSEMQSLREWTDAGGLLIIVDREINIDWSPGLHAETTYRRGSANAKPVQPTIYTRNVNKVALSGAATRVSLEGSSATYHIGDSIGGVLADVRLGRGRVLMLTDPYVIANNGIAEADNLFLAINLVADRPSGLIAFDEFHHGYGSGLFDKASGGLMSYFRGTPVPWMMAQSLLIVALAIYARGRRFGRPLPVKHERRTTNLEFVSSMANIARLAKATDLAMQNIYSEFRRKLCRYVSLPATVETPRLATAVARRGRLDEAHLRSLLMKCELVSRGKHVSDSELLGLVTRVREIEAILKA